MTNKKRTVLVVDDDAIDRELVQRSIKRHEVDFVAKALTAYRAVQDNHYDVAIVDIGLPDAVAHEVLDLIALHCPVIAISGANPKQELSHPFCLKSNADNLPLMIEEVVNKS